MSVRGEIEHPLPAGEGSYRLRRSSRARQLRIEVRADSLLVVLPRGVPEASAHRLVAERMSWILQTRERLRQRREHATADAPEWVAGERQVLWRGRPWPVIVCRRSGHSPEVAVKSDGVRVRLSSATGTTDSAANLRAALGRWLRAEAATQVAERLPILVASTGLCPSSWRISAQRGRWGSCGIHDRLHLNWRLAMAPPAVLDYVMVHELCHLRHRDHSARFWSLVSRHAPAWKAQRRWLREHGHWLMAALE